MAAFSNKKQMQMKAETLAKKTKFNKHEIEALLTMFRELTKNTGKLDRTMFRDILHNQFKMTDDIIMDRVFRVFDQDNDTCVNADEWVKGLSTFLRGALEDRMKFCFAVFDMNGDGFISREDMFQFLKNCIVKQTIDEDAEEGVKDLVDIMVKKMVTQTFLSKMNDIDYTVKPVQIDRTSGRSFWTGGRGSQDLDHDARLSFDDFRQSVEEESLLLEAFGPCLPDETSVGHFTETFWDMDARENFINSIKH